jgi:hypothetical protein
MSTVSGPSAPPPAKPPQTPLRHRTTSRKAFRSGPFALHTSLAGVKRSSYTCKPNFPGNSTIPSHHVVISGASLWGGWVTRGSPRERKTAIPANNDVFGVQFGGGWSRVPKCTSVQPGRHPNSAAGGLPAARLATPRTINHTRHTTAKWHHWGRKTGHVYQR